MSEEHIWGDWLKAYIPPRMNKHNMQAVRINRPNEATTGNIFLKAGDPYVVRSRLSALTVTISGLVTFKIVQNPS
jgi:hypothetical protein